jgi:hypothetical protein
VSRPDAAQTRLLVAAGTRGVILLVEPVLALPSLLKVRHFILEVPVNP